MGTQGMLLGEIAFSSSGKRLAVRHVLGTILVFDTETWQVISECRLPAGNSVAFLPNNDDLLVAGGDDGIVRGWNVSPMESADAILDHPAQVLDLKFSPNGLVLAVGMADGAVQFWDVVRRTKLFDIPPHAGDPWRDRYNAYHFDFIAFSPDSKYVTVIGPHDTLSI